MIGRGRPWRLRPGVLLAAGFLAVVLLAPSGRVRAELDPLTAEVRVAPELRRWTFETAGGDDHANQSYLPIDLAVTRGPDLRLTGGVDLVSSAVHGVDPSGNLDGLGDLRLGGEIGLPGRVRLGAAGRFALHEDALPPREVRIAEVLEIFQLDFPYSRPAAGDRVRLLAAWQPVKLSRLLCQIGASYELRGSYALRDDGLELRPGSVFRLAAGVDAVLGPLRARQGLIHERPGTSQLGGADAFEVGSRSVLTESIALERGVDAFELRVALLLAGRGSVLSRPDLEAAPLRGGNELSWGLTWSRSSGGWGFGAGVDGRHYRGFSGPLGRADWVTPAVEASRALGRDSLGARLDVSVGEGRSGRRIRGAGLALSWTRTLLR